MGKITRLECGKFKRQSVLLLTLIASALLSINFIFKLDVQFTIGRVVGGIFQIVNIVLSLKGE